MSLQLSTTSYCKKEIAEILRKVADWIDASKNESLEITLNVVLRSK